MNKALSRTVLSGITGITVVLSAPFAAMACEEHSGEHGGGRSGDAQTRNGDAQTRNGDAQTRNGDAQTRNGDAEEEPDSYANGVSQSDSSLKAGPKGASNGVD
ncbi:hypothetical protein ACFOWE_08090 [Planomonospora corallina]|uniref:Lipoprotein n=1 Tax=Planomonospora corallina TaxID=1806052 RepID=A0ABV8I2H5_9ACTN